MSSSSEALLDHIADFLEFISSAQSFWFSLNTSYDHGCHLASRFCLDPDEYDVLLIVAGLVVYEIWLRNEADDLEEVLRGWGWRKHNNQPRLRWRRFGGSGTAAAAAAAMVEAEKATVAFCRGDDSDERRR